MQVMASGTDLAAGTYTKPKVEPTDTDFSEDAEEGADDGEISVPKKLTIGYFRQDVEEMAGRSVLDEAIAGHLAHAPASGFDPLTDCLLDQAFIKDEDKTMGELLKETIAKTGENMAVKRFSRFSLGS